MEDTVICKHNQTGYCKFQETCSKVHENQICNTKGCDLSKCRKRHPKECKYFAVQKFCQFGRSCRFKHTESIESVKVQQLHEDFKKIKAEVDLLKNNLKALAGIKQEGKMLTKSVESLKEDIKKIKSENINILKRILNIEEDFENESEDESEEQEMNSLQPNNSHNVEMTGENEIEEDDDNEDGAECDLYQIEMVNGDMVWACNLCDHGFDSSLEMKDHMKNKHDKIMNTETVVEDPDKYIELHEDTQDIKSKENKDDSDNNLNDGKFTCTLCLERLDGNHESKEHYIKDHMKDINNTKQGDMCDFGFCMDIEQDRCSQFCNYYKNMIDL